MLEFDSGEYESIAYLLKSQMTGMDGSAWKDPEERNSRFT